MAAPYKRGEERPPHWINPCGGSHPIQRDIEDVSSDSISKSSLDILQAINISAKNALTHAQQFSREFVRKTFGVEYEKHHKDWIHQKYDWLPSKEIPKTLGNILPSHLHPNKHELDTFLVKSYNYLQTLAVGLEQVHKDMEQRGAEFRKHFYEVELNLRHVLCEVRAAISERQPTRVIIDVGREVMGHEFRVIINDSMYRDIRDWIIFREYMNCLEYISQVCEYFISIKKSEEVFLH